MDQIANNNGDHECVFGDMSELFHFDELSTDYADGPLSGWLRRKNDDAWFAYDCKMIVDGLLWHWTLVPSVEKTGDVVKVLEEAARALEGVWVSIVEDRRSRQASLCSLRVIDGTKTRPPLPR